MANQSSDRQRMRNDLQELARLAKPGSDSPVHAFDTADSSGYVDLSAYSMTDAGWVDRELSRARKGAPPPPPTGRARAAGARTIDVLTPASMSPISLELGGAPEDTMNVRPSRARGVLYSTMGLAAVAAVGYLAFTLAKHPPPAATAPATTAAAAVAPAATADAPAAPAVASAGAPAPPSGVLVAAPSPPAATAPAAVVATVSTPAATTAKSKKRAFAAVRSHAAVAQGAAASPPPRAAAVVIPKAAPAGNDSLMDLIKKSVATGK
ncbi:MAG TPA: hypothetical protein VHS09_12860 [Polyangiaceae bacterium]|jgi:hypothetical protein|nr:hypothetical protein [Polyangiaceae bacterium]